MKNKENLKPIFFTSDWHIGHKNVLEYDKRPFADLEEMHEVLVRRFNATVPEDGITYFLGDMGLGSGDALSSVIQKLNGTKVLVTGNHDKGFHSMYRQGFDVVLNGAVIYVAGFRVTMSHCPLTGLPREKVEGMRGALDGENWHGESRHAKYSFKDEGQYHLHGHIHSPNGGKSDRVLGRQMDVGVAANKYTPVSFGAVESWIVKNEQEKKK